MLKERKPNKRVLNLYIRKDMQEAFMKYCEAKKLPRSTIINDLLQAKLSEEGFL